MPYNYNRHSSNPVSNFLQGGVVKKLVVANVAVFFLQILLVRSSFEDFFALFPRMVITKGYVWQLVTYMFLHGDIFHIAINMFIIWMFGTVLERTWGSDRFLKYYFVCGIGAALFSFIFAFNNKVIGASGAGYGMLLAYGVLFPYNEIYVLGLFPVRARTLVIALIIIEFLFGISGGDGIAHFAHLGGMATGLLYLRTDHRTGKIWGRLRNIWEKFPIKIKVENKARKKGEEEEYDSGKIDSILDKISSKGYENLTETEKRILENYSKETEKH